ncbi:MULTISPECIES: hypothetical protein [Cyanophyceae]|uniref:hypothetical protein n=1 Tax=Cyanophyceae TaxID=3028117 RepID=UPI001A7E537A|nr:hypothetical protein [Trichocoleus sp. FACHB-69]
MGYPVVHGVSSRSWGIQSFMGYPNVRGVTSLHPELSQPALSALELRGAFSVALSITAITSRYLHARPNDSSSLYLPG